MKLIPCDHHSKEPLKGKSWRTTMSADPTDHRRWLADGLNWGMPTGSPNEITVVDWDTGMEPALDFQRKYPELCTVAVRTRRGLHRWFKGVTASRKFAHGDIKSEGGYVIIPPSKVEWAEKEVDPVDGSLIDVHTGIFQYEWLERGKLQPFPEHLFPTQQRKEIVRGKINNVRAYLRKVVSIQGQNGSAGLVRAAAICRDAGMSESQATIALLEWNANAAVVSPSWPHEEIARAVTRVFQRGT